MRRASGSVTPGSRPGTAPQRAQSEGGKSRVEQVSCFALHMTAGSRESVKQK